MRFLFLALCALLWSSGAHAQGGSVPNGCAENSDGVIVCLQEPNTGTVNNNPVTLNPNNCGYVNGIYGCYDSGGTKQPDPSGGQPTGAGTPNTPDSGTNQNCGFGDIACNLSAFSTWLSNKFLYVPRKVFEWFGDALGNWISSISVPSFVTQAESALGNLPSGVVWFLDLMQFKFGVTVMFAAISLKFLRRSVPFFV